VILAAINAGTAVGLTLAIAIVVLSAVSAFYYLRVVAAMYFDEPEREPRAESTPLLNVGIGAMAVATLVLGVLFSGELIELAGRWSRALTVAAQAGAGG
jgi:NADH-quinone oxidoreductase subunit N